MVREEAWLQNWSENGRSGVSEWRSLWKIIWLIIFIEYGLEQWNIPGQANPQTGKQQPVTAKHVAKGHELWGQLLNRDVDSKTDKLFDLKKQMCASICALSENRKIHFESRFED